MTPLAVADVVVVGYGGAGASAALEARGNGADVTLLDRFGGGGTTNYSGGVIYAGATRFQRDAGFEDTVENMHAYIRLEVGDAVRPETLWRFCEGSADDVEWLVGHGVEYASDTYLEEDHVSAGRRVPLLFGEREITVVCGRSAAGAAGPSRGRAGFRRRALYRCTAPRA